MSKEGTEKQCLRCQKFWRSPKEDDSRLCPVCMKFFRDFNTPRVHRIQPAKISRKGVVDALQDPQTEVR
jgi:hypothetical protein